MQRLFHSRLCDGRISESASVDAAFGSAITSAVPGHAISEACTRNHSLLAVRSACAISISWPGRHVDRADGGDGQLAFLIRLSCHSVRIAEASGLNFTNGSLDRRLR